MQDSAGLAACVLYIALGAPDWAAWARVGTGAETLQAGTVGLQLPLQFFGVALFLSVLIAVHATEPLV